MDLRLTWGEAVLLSKKEIHAAEVPVNRSQEEYVPFSVSR